MARTHGESAVAKLCQQLANRAFVQHDTEASFQFVPQIHAPPAHHSVTGRIGASLNQPGQFDLLLTDLQMPRMDGFKLCAQVRKDARLKNLPIVVMSTLDTPETKRMALDAGADAYLVKASFAAETLVATIGHVIR